MRMSIEEARRRLEEYRAFRVDARCLSPEERLELHACLTDRYFRFMNEYPALYDEWYREQIRMRTRDKVEALSAATRRKNASS
jgi:hypothetical protein